jgi:hypothetical protein
MAQQMQTRTRVENPARWIRAAERAVAEGIQVRQLQGTGQWIATSGSQTGLAYEVAVTGNVAHGCDCLAGLNGDPVCKHRAAYYLLIGALDLSPEPDPPALGASLCFHCSGSGVQWYRSGYAQPCPTCAGTGRTPLVAQAEVLRAAAQDVEPGHGGDHCGGPLDYEARTNEAQQSLCGTRVRAEREPARRALTDASSAAHAQPSAALAG